MIQKNITTTIIVEPNTVVKSISIDQKFFIKNKEIQGLDLSSNPEYMYQPSEVEAVDVMEIDVKFLFSEKLTLSMDDIILKNDGSIFTRVVENKKLKSNILG